MNCKSSHNSAGFPISAVAVGMLAMAAVVLASNILVQFPVHMNFGPIQLADILTWGAFTYPAAFLVTDLTNRRFGPSAARRIVYFGFFAAVVLSIALATPRIAVASGAAFLTAQLIDVSVFNRLRQKAWWQAPLISSFLGSLIDTTIFFTLAFSASIVFLGAADAFAVESSKFLGIFAMEFPRWVSWAAGDLAVKILVATVLLAPYRLINTIISSGKDAHAV